MKKTLFKQNYGVLQVPLVDIFHPKMQKMNLFAIDHTSFLSPMPANSRRTAQTDRYIILFINKNIVYTGFLWSTDVSILALYLNYLYGFFDQLAYWQNRCDVTIDTFDQSGWSSKHRAGCQSSFINQIALEQTTSVISLFSRIHEIMKICRRELIGETMYSLKHQLHHLLIWCALRSIIKGHWNLSAFIKASSNVIIFAWDIRNFGMEYQCGVFFAIFAYILKITEYFWILSILWNYKYGTRKWISKVSKNQRLTIFWVFDKLRAEIHPCRNLIE